MKYCQEICTNEATYKVSWPCREILFMCGLCMIKAKSIASVMGFFIFTEKMEKEIEC